jgi:hypothetical protein
MNRVMFLLFAIPVISIAVIAFYQFFTETFQKKFVVERRIKSYTVQLPDAPLSEYRRRYSDDVPPGTLRNPETSATGRRLVLVAKRVDTETSAI